MHRGLMGQRINHKAGWLLVIAAIALLLVGPVRGTFALFSGRTTNPANSPALQALYAPASLTAIAAGNNIQLNWPAGVNGNKYVLLGGSNGTNSVCPPATNTAFYATILASPTTLNYTDARSAPPGSWYCYQVQTAYGPWTSVLNNPVAAAQPGFVVSSVSIIKGGVAGQIDTGDQIVLNFNQPVNPASGPDATNTVCTMGNSDTIYLASTVTGGNCSNGEPLKLGTLTGGAVKRNSRYQATYVWNNSNKTLTVTIGAEITGNGKAPTSAGTLTFNPVTTATYLRSATGAIHVCDTNATGGNCLPTVTGNF